MLASIPACILNQIETDSGIPLDSNKIRKALDVLSGTPLDKGVYLDQLKTVPMEKQKPAGGDAQK
jgi:hypothetical protein